MNSPISGDLKMENWLKGTAGATFGLIIVGITVGIGYYFGVGSSAVALSCAALVAGAFLSLTYAIENNDSMAGAAMPILLGSAIVVGYFGQPPLPSTLGLCFFATIFGIVMIQEGE